MRNRNIEICGMKRSNLMTRMARSFTSTLFRIDRLVVGLALFLVAAMPAAPQQLPAKPPTVGVVAATRKPVTQSSEYVGRIQAIERVNLTARVAAFLDQRFFTEGAEVKKDDPLYRLEEGPFLADAKAKEATIAQLKAQLKNAQIVLGRAKALLNGPAGQQSTVDSATANSESLEAQVLAAEAQLQQSQINLGYTDIRAPIDGKIGRTAVTAGNYVSPSSGILATIVSQDPMHVAFAISSQKAISLSRRATETPVVVKIRLGDGHIYDQIGTLNFVDNVVAGNTDTITLRGDIRNPPIVSKKTGGTTRELVDGQFVTVLLEDAEPIEAVTIPRAAVLTDQQGDFIYVVDGENKAQQRRIKLGPDTPGTAAVMSGLSEGERVVVEGLQRIRPGLLVSPTSTGSAERTAGASAPG
jgi:membrane fusion protein (multidrug efflux system)